MGDQQVISSMNFKRGQTGLPKDVAFYDDVRDVAGTSVLPPVGVTPSPTSIKMILECDPPQTDEGAMDSRELCESTTTDIALGRTFRHASLLRDKSGGSISTMHSDEIEEWKRIVELPKNLRRASLFRDLSGCSSICTSWSFLAPRGSLENLCALDPMFASSESAHSDLTVHEGYCTERLERLKSDQDEKINRSNNDQYTTTGTHLPGFNSPWDFKRMLFYGTCSLDPPNANTAVVFGGISNYASTDSSTWLYSSTGANGLHFKNQFALPCPQASGPLDLDLSLERRSVHEQPRLSARAIVDRCADARVPTEIDIVALPAPPCSSIHTSPVQKKQAPHRVAEEGIYVLDGYRDNDVLCGKGERITRHHGHKLFHKEKANFQAQYRRTTIKREKTVLAEKLLDTMARKYGSRFLAFCPQKQQWYMISHERAMKKAKQVLRESFTAEQRRQKRERYCKPAKMRRDSLTRIGPK
jgi:hypothetical protein